jgi:hypothetical protein
VNHHHGIRFLIKDSLKKYVKNIMPYSERIITFQLTRTSTNLNLIQVYGPSEDKQDSDATQSYEKLLNALRMINKKEINIIVGDFNAKIGRAVAKGVVEK